MLKQSAEIEGYVKDYQTNRIEQKKRMLKTDRTRLNHLICEALDALINQQEDKQTYDGQKEIRYLYLCRLSSTGSRYTQSYKVLLGMSNSMLYLDDGRTDVFWYPEPIYQGMKKDIEELQALLKEKGIQPEEKTLLEWKQKLLDDNWGLLLEQFMELIQENFHRITDSSLMVADRISVLCGNYMERLPAIWEAEICG